MSRLRLLLIIAFFPAAFATVCRAETHEKASDIFDITSAMEFCDNELISDPEGIWEFPDDETVVMIRRSQWNRHSFDIILLTTPDCRLHGGDIIGYAERNAEQRKFKVKLFTQLKHDFLSDPGECLGELNSDGTAFLFQPKKYKISFSVRGFSILPKFWRLINISVKNPLDNLKRGMVKIYPALPGKQEGFDSPVYF